MPPTAYIRRCTAYLNVFYRRRLLRRIPSLSTFIALSAAPARCQNILRKRLFPEYFANLKTEWRRNSIQRLENILDRSHRSSAISSILTSYQAEWISQIHQDHNEMLAFENMDNGQEHTVPAVFLFFFFLFLLPIITFKARSEEALICLHRYKSQGGSTKPDRLHIGHLWTVLASIDSI